MSAAEDAFARALYAQLAKEPGNLAVSPASVRACVLLALAGARGKTAEEIAATLKLTDAERADVGRLLAAVGAEVKTGGVQLSVANSAWVQQGFPIHEAYRKLLSTDGRATFETVDFADAATAVSAINAWVDQATRHKIAKLLDSNAVDGSTRLVLANAVYFKGDWLVRFDERYTKPAPFHRPGEADMEVQLMHNISHFNYLETESYQAVEMKYAEGPYSMIVWLPRDVAGLDRLETALATGDEAGRLSNLKRAKVDLFLPRFKVEGNSPLGDILSAMGMAGAFQRTADFSGISDEPLWLSAVVHQALVKVNETGTEAAAATAIIAVGSAAPAVPEEPKLFRADHPFLFAIRNSATGELLFMGRVVQPQD